MTPRIGWGYDVHRLVEGRSLILGGVSVPWERGLLGHSDADVVLVESTYGDRLHEADDRGDRLARSAGWVRRARVGHRQRPWFATAAALLGLGGGRLERALALRQVARASGGQFFTARPVASAAMPRGCS